MLPPTVSFMDKTAREVRRLTVLSARRRALHPSPALAHPFSVRTSKPCHFPVLSTLETWLRQMVYIELETAISDLLAEQVVFTALLAAMTSSFT